VWSRYALSLARSRQAHRICLCRYFDNVQIKRFLPFAKCDACSQFLDRILAANTEADREKVKEERKCHRQEVLVARTHLTTRDVLAVEYPDWFIEILQDAMDQNKTAHPLQGNAESIERLSKLMPTT
jgi:hypothetical protein